MLTTYDHDEYVSEALRAGARGFILTSQRPDEIVSAIKVVAAGEAVLAPSTTLRLIEAYRTGGIPAPVAMSPVAGQTLTGREREVLRLLARGESTSGIARQSLR
jgi:DNA-binding NarL/FixJ family response regulator